MLNTSQHVIILWFFFNAMNEIRVMIKGLIWVFRSTLFLLDGYKVWGLVTSVQLVKGPTVQSLGVRVF